MTSLSPTALRGMLRADGLRLQRDQFLIGMGAYVIFVSVVMRWAIPWATSEIASRTEFDLTPYHVVLVSYFTIQLAPYIPGFIGGFLLLESREDRTVHAMLVSPQPLHNYLWVVCFVMVLTGFALTLLECVVIGVGTPPWTALVPITVAASTTAPIFALLLAGIANNKVEAFAYLKFLGIGPALATAAYFVPEPYQWLAALYPPYCASKAFWIAEAGGAHWLIWVAASLVGSGVWLFLLVRFFVNRVRP